MTSDLRTLPPPESLVIRASAGTGKTYQLAMRYIALLAQGERPESLLATTFTRKAAGEMLERVLKFLAQATHDPQRLAELQQHAHPSLSTARCSHLLQDLIASFGKIRIQTLDALLQQVAGAAALSIGISPSWTILDDAEQDELRLDTIGDLVSQQDRSAPALLAQLTHLSLSGPSSSVHKPLTSHLKSATAAYLEANQDPHPWYVLQPNTQLLTPQQLQHIAEQLATRTDLAPLTKRGTPNAKYASGLATLAECIRDRNWAKVCDGTLVPRLHDDSPEYQGAIMPDVLVQLLLPLLDHIRADLRQKLFERNVNGFAIISTFESLALESRHAAATYTFSDIPRLLRSTPFEGGLDHTFFSLDATIRHILLDEFQDTSLDQFNLIKVLLDECAHSEDGRTVFFVGDSKQSLYSWRGGTPELLDALGTSALYPHITRQDLSTNYRSGRNILACVNDTFSTLISNPALVAKAPAAAASWSGRFSTHVPSPNAPEGSVAIRLAGVPAEGESTADCLAAATAERIADVRAQCPHASIAVLVRNKSRFARLRYELSRRGIDASQEGVARLVDSPTVAAVLSLLHLIAHPADTAARYHVATSPLGTILQYTDHTCSRAALSLARRGRATIRRRTLPRVLAKLSRLLAPHSDLRGTQRLSRLVELASSDPSPLDLDRFVRIARKHTLHDASDVRVRLMTVHNAKGLEFDIVFLPDLHNTWSLNQSTVLTSRPSPLEPLNLVTLAPSAGLRKIDPEIQALHQANLDRKISEELSVLYVAMTRAIHHMEIILPGKVRSKSKDHSSIPCSAAGILYTPFHIADKVIFPDAAPPGQPMTLDPIYSRGTFAIPPSVARPSVPPRVHTLALARPHTTRPTSLRRVSPSGLEGSSIVNLSDLIAPPSASLAAAASSALLKGRALHALFEQIEWLESSAPLPAALSDAHLTSTLTKLDVPAPLIDSFIAEFRKLVKEPAIRALLARPDIPSVVRREWAFLTPSTLPDGSQVLLDGRFDRVHIHLDSRGHPVSAHIIDFKTDTPSPVPPPGSSPASLTSSPHADRIHHYTPQIHAYSAALATLLHLPPASITASLLFTSTATVVSIPPSSASPLPPPSTP